MEDILYDYHIALEASKQPGKDALAPKIYETATLKKHEVSQADFDSSMVYYSRHTELLHTIYESLSERLNREALALGTSASELNKYGALSSTGDTANVWNGERNLTLVLHTPHVSYSFANAVDTTYHAGDSFVLDFDANFIFQDGIRDMVVMLAVKFKNDSTASTLLHCSQSSHFSLTVSDNNRKGIKEVKGFFMLNPSRGNDASQTTMKLVIVNNIHLIRFHNRQTQPVSPSPSASPADSLQPARAPQDSAKTEPRPSPEGARKSLPARLLHNTRRFVPEAERNIAKHPADRKITPNK